MKVIVCGAGQVGWQIARHLATENNDVTVVDSNAALVRRATDTLDVGGITGFASHPDVLEQAGARDADMIIAATFADEVNMVACQVAHSVFSVPRKIARLRAQSYLSPEWSDLFRRDHMPIDVIISPEREVADSALRRLNAQAAFETGSFLDGKLMLMGITLDENCPVLKTPLRQLTELFSTLRAIVVAIRRGGKLHAAYADDQLYDGDQVYLTVAVEDQARALEIFGKSSRRAERIILIGAGNVGLTVANHIDKGDKRVRAKIIERDRARAEKAADALDRTIVLHGDGLDMDLLEEANLSSCDALIALTDDDKTNLLTCTRAKAAGCPMVIALVNDASLMQLMEPLGIDAYINPRATTVSSILRHVRHGRVRAVYSIGDAEAEVMEAHVLGTSSIAGKRVRDCDFPERSILGAVLKGDTVVIPRGDTVLQEGDILVVFAMAADVRRVEQMFRVAVDYF
ncbi:Trk system potassium transporter TrkA [Paroceanicella profunda]|uniref:Trk system potassium uptake protein TrkA n=1 Tax=Paroceanicella profunda TaxID=2579971 RepID=A0A5B8FHV2_9RHOB|nr:Trk system potassium transporter TrkA [Paroceanicella profunda]QDL92891.1 Trk system potassium transporter TrkA [Paroceanicella profunda]